MNSPYYPCRPIGGGMMNPYGYPMGPPPRSGYGMPPMGPPMGPPPMRPFF